ncbi:MAG: ADP-dependent NAD(P)H-hydrate dehydratase / NAD(P)H-hydrate epimerase [Solirubrobacteraceae bacterium]|nr:ADP-dependent NAD(P)H-hydrate dehydratase / NAD(P)H-hydrate epimerase [Solirubrobacteraceae bacterium]
MDALPDWLIALPDAETMRAIDRWAIDRSKTGQQGVPGLELMERAGAAVARAVEVHCADGPAAVVCGKGNNGGDGLVAARQLREAGREVTVVCVAPLEEFSGDAAENLRRLPGEAPVSLADGMPAIAGAAVAVDALLGTGFAGEPHGPTATAIEELNASAAPVVAVDVPSGVDASTGVVAGSAVRAAVTVTFHAAKPGLWIRPGKTYAGDVHTVDIGIPRGAPMTATIGLIADSVRERLPRRDAESTKFASGQVVVAGGSRGLAGAPCMASRASMRAGAGYVTACVPRSLQDVIAGAGTPELMTRGLPEEDGAFDATAAEGVIEGIRPGGALALGPGLGRTSGAFAFARELARDADAPMVLDADGLNAHAGRLGDLAARSKATVLTPHAGELARLLELDSRQIERERLRHARAAAEQAHAVVVLKGDDTLIAAADGHVAVSQGGSPALATAGTGDVLTGVIAALLAQGLDAFTAACAGVWLHAQAGRGAARRQGAVEGVIASDVIESLPAARRGDA